MGILDISTCVILIAQLKTDKSLSGMVAFTFNIPVSRYRVGIFRINKNKSIGFDTVPCNWLHDTHRLIFGVSTKTKKYQTFIQCLKDELPKKELEIYTELEDLEIISPDLIRAWDDYFDSYPMF